MDYGKLIWRDASGDIQTWKLRAGLNTIGASELNDVVLSGAGVEDTHVEIRCKQGVCQLQAIGTVELNHSELRAGETAQLHYNDRIRIDATVLRYTYSDEERVPPKPLPQAVLPEKWEEGIWATPPEVAGKIWRGDRGASNTWDIILQPSGSFVELSHMPSEYLQYLPPLYHQGANDLVNNLLLAFEMILKPIEHMIDQIDGYFNPWVAPEAMLPWLASWVAMVIDPELPRERQRELIARAAELYRARGTRLGLREYLRIYTGAEPTIIEPGDPGSDSPPLAPNCFHVILEVPETAPQEERLLDPAKQAEARERRRQALEARLRRLIEAEKPAHTRYYLTLALVPSQPHASSA